jgi:hypothetical protein
VCCDFPSQPHMYAHAACPPRPRLPLLSLLSSF